MFHDTVVNKPMHLSLYMERRYVLIKNIAYFEVAWMKILSLMVLSLNIGIQILLVN